MDVEALTDALADVDALTAVDDAIGVNDETGESGDKATELIFFPLDKSYQNLI